MEIKSRLPEQLTDDIVSVIKDFISHWNQKDLEKFGKLFTEQAEFTDVVGQTAIGREAIIQQHVFPFQVVMKKAQFEMNDLYLRQLVDNIVMVSAMWKVVGSLTPTGAQLPDRSGVIQIILNKQSSDWKILLVHNSDNALPYERQERFV